MVATADNNNLCRFPLGWYCLEEFSRELCGEQADVTLIVVAEEMPYCSFDRYLSTISFAFQDHSTSITRVLLNFNPSVNELSQEMKC